jgi:hypothetical protein
MGRVVLPTHDAARPVARGRARRTYGEARQSYPAPMVAAGVRSTSNCCRSLDRCHVRLAPSSCERWSDASRTVESLQNGEWSRPFHPAFRLGFNALARSELARRRQKRPLLRQHFLKRRVEPHGHKSLSPRRSTSSTSPSRIVRAPASRVSPTGSPCDACSSAQKENDSSGSVFSRGMGASLHICSRGLGLGISPKDRVEGLQTCGDRDKRSGSEPIGQAAVRTTGASCGRAG